jgi:hypothetical protein
MYVSASPTAPSSLPSRVILVGALLCLLCSNALAQATSSDYTVDLPSVERVKAEIKGSDPADTLARQVAVFTYLYTYVDRIKLNRSYSGPYTPGETRVMTAYRLAAYQISQDYAKSHTPDEAKAFERLHGQYEMNSDFYKDWSKRLIGPQSAAAYKGAETGLAATQRAHIAQEQQQNQKDVAAQSSASGLSNDPTAVATRRCLELGGDSTACVGKSFVGGLMNMIGFGSETMDALTGPSRAGVVLSGTYRGPATSINFADATSTIVHCGTLEGVGAAYTLHKSPSALEITLQTEPHPIQLSMRPDGSLIGPGPVDVKGQIIIGYHTVTTTQMINGARAAPNQCNGPCQTISQVPDYAPKTERCSIASFAPPPPSPPASAAKSQDAGIFGALTSMMGTIAPTSEPGLRMAGKFSSSTGLLLDFGGDAVTLDCGPAHVKQPYAVENSPAQLVIHVQNNGGPFTLAVAPDNTLRGSGSTTVNGRLVSGMNGDNVTFSPRSEHCNVGTFTSGATASSTSIASNSATSAGPAAAPAAYASSPSAAPIAPTSTPSVRASMRVLITSEFPSGPNPLIGQSVIVMRKPIDQVLRELGIPVPPNATPGQAMQTFAATCRTSDCRPIFSGLNSYSVTAVKLDSTGKAVLSAQAATGPYFIYAIVRVPNGPSYVWDIPTNLSAGDNTITLTAANAELIH